VNAREKVGQDVVVVVGAWCTDWGGRDGDQDYVGPNGLVTGRANVHVSWIAQEIHYEARSVSENLAERGARGSGLTRHMASAAGVK
jgi:hypothetical protein